MRQPTVRNGVVPVTGNLLYLCGAPGVGKSSVMRVLRAPWDQEVMSAATVPHVRLRHPASRVPAGLELGVPRPSFPGTDALSMSIGPRAAEFMLRTPVPFVLAEGARLATRPFLGACATGGVNVTLVHLRADPELLDERWRARGSKQNPSWRKGAATRARGAAEWFRSHVGQPGFVQLAEINCTEMTVDEVAGLVFSLFPHVDIREALPARPVGD